MLKKSVSARGLDHTTSDYEAGTLSTVPLGPVVLAWPGLVCDIEYMIATP
jgi:hypothetical protein